MLAKVINVAQIAKRGGKKKVAVGQAPWVGETAKSLRYKAQKKTGGRYRNHTVHASGLCYAHRM